MKSLTVPTSTERSDNENRFDLGALFEFSNIINSSLELKFILGHLLLTIMGKLLALRGIVLLAKDDGSFTVANVKGLPSELIGTGMIIDKLPRRILHTSEAEIRKHPWMSYFKDHGITLLLPLIARDKILGLAGFAISSTKQKLSSKEETYVKSLANIATGAIEKGIVFQELNSVNRRLDGKIQELKTLFELNKEFGSVLNEDRLIKLLIFSIMGQIGANRYFLCLTNNGRMEIAASRLNKELHHDCFEYFAGIKAPTLVASLMAKRDQRIKELLSDAGVHVLIPLQIQNQTKGIIGLGEKMRGGVYLETDLEFLSSLGNLAIISLENARLFREAIEKQKLEDELIIAKEIQRALLPSKLPSIPNVDLAATNISSKQVGGDYYDMVALGNDRFMIAIGDVSGKGAPASLLMANLQATIRALISLDVPLSDLTKRVNELMCENTTSGRFITFFWGILDANARSFTYVSAGHNPPMIFRTDGSIERLDKGGIILGIMRKTFPYEEGTVMLQRGDVLVMFTDGVTEAMNASGEELGEERLLEIGERHGRDSAQVLLTKIVDEVRQHSNDVPQSDDITLVVAKIT
jgi:sigma-B regulation protein RsbU (phosphoserine phosphatase)